MAGRTTFEGGALAVDRDALARSLRALRRQAPGGVELTGALDDVTGATGDLFGVDGAGLMLRDDTGVLRWVSVSDGGGLVLERVQQELGEGPCLDALRVNRPVAVTNVAADARYPRLARVLAQHAICAVLSVPVRVHGEPMGTLNVYAATARPWDPDDIGAVEAYAGVVGRVLEAVEQAERSAQLEYALDARVRIEQAKGVLMARHGLTAPAAFERLRGTARASRRRVAEVADELLGATVAGGGAPDGRAPGPPARDGRAGDGLARRTPSVDLTECHRAIAAALRDAATTAEALQIVVREGAAALGAPVGMLALLHGGRLDVAATVGAAGQPSHIVLDGPAPITDAVRLLAPVTVGSGSERTRRWPNAATVLSGCEALMSVPLVAVGQGLGVLVFGFRERRAFGEAEQLFATLLAGEAATAVLRGRLPLSPAGASDGAGDGISTDGQG